jgi:hypothetical protein
VIDSTCIRVLKLLVINGDETIEGSIDGLWSCKWTKERWWGVREAHRRWVEHE